MPGNSSSYPEGKGPRFGRSIALVVLIAWTTAAFASSPVGQAGGRAAAAEASYRWKQVTPKATFPEAYNYPVHVARGRMWALHAEGTWSSTDGRQWRKEALPSARRNVYESQYAFSGDAVYAFGMNEGNYLDMRFRPTIRRSKDLRRWEVLSERSNLPPRIFYGLAFFGGKFWLTGGYDGKRYHNDVWSSPDGVHWRRVAEKAEWPPRSGSMLVAFRGRLWLIGGGVIDGDKVIDPRSQHQIWTSVDGIAWRKAGEGLPQHSGGTPVVFDGQLWLVGANRDGRFGRASLVTRDGIHWREEAAPWTPRGGAAAWVFDGKLWMTGGKYSITENGQIRFIYSNDVWTMEKVAGRASGRR
ncbi:hypothetical protein [Arenimonas sp.]|uniref:hypothetical protein n=1 Tax=Arenimonas sp. TaxID=1872635 RepID=UPI0039E41E84